MNNGIVDLEIYDSTTSAKVSQGFVVGQNLSPGQTATYRYLWPVPNAAAGYTVMVGVFGANWTPDYFWDSSAGHLAVP